MVLLQQTLAYGRRNADRYSRSYAHQKNNRQKDGKELIHFCSCLIDDLRSKRCLKGLCHLDHGARIFMLTEDEPVGIVSVTGSLIEDLYILPEYQNRGYGTRLLHYAIRRCEGVPTLWILENNLDAGRLYRREGFRETGRRNMITDKLDEIEFSLQ